MKKRNLLLVMLAVLLVFGMVMSCGPVEEEEPVDVNFTGAGANGNDDVSTTTLTLTFDTEITGLTASHITLSSSTGATKGALSGSGQSYNLAVSGITSSGIVTITVAKVGNFNIIGTQTVQVVYSAKQGAAKFFGDYVATYSLSGTPTTETITISANKIEIYELKTGQTTKDDFIDFTIDKWEVGSEDGYTAPSSFTVSYKLTGKITDAKPKTGTPLYGGKTAPGIGPSDINKTAYVYLYFDVSDSIDIDLMRSPFSLNGHALFNGSALYIVTGSDDAVRKYTSK